MHKDKSELCIRKSFLRLQAPTTEKTKENSVGVDDFLDRMWLEFLLVFSDVARLQLRPAEDSQSRERLAQLNRFSRRVTFVALLHIV